MISRKFTHLKCIYVFDFEYFQEINEVFKVPINIFVKEKKKRLSFVSHRKLWTVEEKLFKKVQLICNN